MNKINSVNTLDILKYIIRHNEINRDAFTIIITGRVGPTGKTWLCKELCNKGYRAMEMSPMVHSLMINNDGVNHVIVDEGVKQVIVVLNEILPMYWGKGFEVSDFDPSGAYTFKTRAEADAVLWEMVQTAEEYGVVTRADFKEILNFKIDKEDLKYGWLPDGISKARVVRMRLGYFIEFPRALPIC